MRKLMLYRIYCHFKGDYYLVETAVFDLETRKLYGGGSLWVQSKAMFLSEAGHAKYPDCTQT